VTVALGKGAGMSLSFVYISMVIGVLILCAHTIGDNLEKVKQLRGEIFYRTRGKLS